MSIGGAENVETPFEIVNRKNIEALNQALIEERRNFKAASQRATDAINQCQMLRNELEQLKILVYTKL